ncbi:hypothetical protein [Aliikangiella coralliicola]|uniref:Uncharacterized protein n=1 Tax=Aliikangiella coralliicola TaxID=2592383 RepID=A0A545U7K8_9GAMM|nr:hypothetical protein [Aliikangiella coralliicola]TQV85452.1 hypothetical protein FLL46_20010 [Aliikangiella coralliicola]
MLIRITAMILLLSIVSFASQSAANQITAKEIPSDLADWKDWVQYQQSYRGCPNLNGTKVGNKKNHLCAWPGQLLIDANDSGASFTQRWEVLDETFIPLPGEQNFWPQRVTVNKKDLTVIEKKGLPYLLLDKGAYVVSGNISWLKRPESLRVPDEVSLLDVSVNEKKQAFILREKGKVWLGSVKKAAIKQQDFLKLRVNRLITDAHPMRMTLAIQLEISGRAREELLTRFNPEHYQLMAIQSALNTRIDSQGDLWVQLKPGRHSIQLEFKIHDFPQQLIFTETGKHWPAQELWVYQSNERLRSTQIVDVSPIDAEQGLMSEWQNLPHYVVNQGDKFTINERQRGLSHNGDSLSLDRQMWLSFDNQTYYFFDSIKGSKSKDWRVNTLENYRLTQLSNHGNERLITLDDKQRTGAEIRTPVLDIRAGGEVQSEDMSHASGWDIDFATTKVVLNIPPGRKLINISGTDSAYGDWVNRWKLIDIFFVLVTVALVFKVFGVIAGAVAAVTLVLGYHESNMPVFGWFNLMVAMSLAIKVTSEKLSKALNIYKWGSVVILVLTLLPFLADQIRYTLYPQLEMNKSLGSSYSDNYLASSPVAQLAEEKLMRRAPSAAKPKLREQQKIEVTGSRLRRDELDTTYEQGAVIQAGKGRPGWNWQKAGYGWNGPVAGSEKVDLIILSENWVRVWRVALIIFSVIWLLVIFSRNNTIKNRWSSLFNRNSEADDNQKNNASGSPVSSLVFLIGAIALFGGASTQSVFANNYPSDKLLQELQARLYPAPECQPDCVLISRADLNINEENAELILQYQSGSNVAGLLPESTDWRISEIFINQRPVKNIWRNKSGSWIQLPKGNSEVVLKTQLKDKSDLTIRFPEKPKTLEHQVKGWEVSGVNLQRLVSNSLQLTRVVQSAKNELNKDTVNSQEAMEQSIADLFFVTRSFSFGSQWKLTTRVNRVAPKQGTLTTNIPLLKYEQPLQMTDNIKNGEMQVVLPNKRHSVSWISSVVTSEKANKTQLAESKSGVSEFELVASNNRSMSESWEILVYPNWNIQLNGLPAVRPYNSANDDFWVYQYFPRAGEKLSFSIHKPSASKGASLAITKVTQNYSVSKRKTTTDLNIDYRSTRAEQFLLHIGKAELKQLTHDGKQINLGEVDGVVSVGLKPGKHQLQLKLEAPQEVDFKLNLAGAVVNREFTNLSTRVNLPSSRWLIAADGPGYGPAVIYWGELIFFILLAIGLSRLSFSPLSYWQWLILGLGMSTFSWPAMAWVSIWLLAGSWRRENKAVSDKQPLLSGWLILLSTITAVLVLIAAVPYGLLQTPDMGVVGNGSYKNSLLWFLDQGDIGFGEVTVYTLPIWVYKGLMLLWATWLSFSLIKWLGWSWQDLSETRLVNTKDKKSKVNESGEKEPKAEE